MLDDYLGVRRGRQAVALERPAAAANAPADTGLCLPQALQTARAALRY